MGPTTELRRELKARFYPFAQQIGFAADLRDEPRSAVFRRQIRDRVQLFDLQWEKYGKPRFSLNFGTCSAKGLSIQGHLHPPETVFAAWCPDAGTLQPCKGTSNRRWFRQDNRFVQRLLGQPALRNPADVVTELLRLFGELERYWSTGEVGRHMRIWDPRNSRGV
jgi:hypothetical protein